MKKLTPSLFALICVLWVSSVQAQVAPEQARNYQINETHTGSINVPNLLPPLKQKWSVNFGQDMSYPLIADGKVFVTVRYASTYGTQLYALSAADGSIVWSYALGGSYSWSALCYENGRVFALNADGLLRAFDGASGAVIWSRQLLGISFNSAPTVFQGVIYTGGSGSGGIAHAVSADTGNVLWTTTISAGGNTSPAVTTDGVYLSYSCINVNKRNPADGSQIWRNYVACGTGSGRAPVVYNGRVYARSPGSNADWIYNSQTGGIFDTFNSKSTPAFSGNMGFFLNGPRNSGTYGTLEGRNVNTNLVHWSFPGDGFLQSAILVVNDYVYVGSNSGKLFAVEAATGQQVWSTTAGTSIPYVDEWTSSQPTTGFAAGEGILVVPTKTTLVAYESDNSPTITWDNPTPAKNVYGWNNTPVQLFFTAVAHPSGEAFATPGSPLQFNSEGNNQTQQVTVIDQLGQSATLTSPVVKIDLTNPVTTNSVSGTSAPGNSAWYQNSAQVTLTKTDNLSGVRGTSYTIDGGTTQNYVAPLTIQTDGSHTVNFWSFDYAGNNETQQSIVVNVDVNAPSTQISTGSGFYASPAQVSLTATDSGSGVANTFYRIDSGATQTYSAPFMVSGDSNRQIVYWSVDNAGHTESQHFFTLKLDGSAPSTGISLVGTSSNGWRITPVQVTLSPSDTRSGVAATYYTLDGGPTQTYSGPFMINDSAIHQLNFWSVDNVGNTEAQKLETIKIDKEGPTTESSLSGPAGNNDYFKGPVQVALTATDNVSGVASFGIHYKIDNGPQMAYMSSPFTVSGEGTHTVSFWSTDLAGNSASPNTITIKIDATAPASQAALAGTAGGGGWYSSEVQVTLSATDNHSAVDSTYYAIDGGPAQTYAAPFTLPNSGTHTILYWSVDRAGNAESQRSTIIKVDVDAPTTQASVSSSASYDGWFQSPAQVVFAASDSVSGVANTYYTIDGGATQTYTGQFNITAAGIHTVNYWTVDTAGNAEAQQSLTVKIDTTAPSTEVSNSGTLGANGWYTTEVQVTLSRTDSQSGVKNTYYTIDGGLQQPYSAPFTISTTGTHTVLYWSTDQVGNVESQQSIIIKIDASAPVTQATTYGTSFGDWYLSPAQVGFTRSDDGSGYASTYFSIDGGASQTYSGPFNVSGEGIHTVNYWTVDTAGNAEAQQSLTVKIDTTAPTTQLSGSGTVGANGWYRSSVQVSLAASDSQSGVNVTLYRVDGGLTQVYSGPFVVSGEGQHQVSYWSNDKLSNTETQQNATIKIDSTIPTATNSVSGPAGGNGYFKGAVQFTITAADSLSGVANRYYRIDGGAVQTYGSPFTVSGDGNHAVDFWSVDLAGNASNTASVMIKIDTTPPSTQASGSGTAGTNGWYLGAVQVSLAASDPLSGVQITYYKIDGGTTKTYTVPFSVSGNGAHSVTFWSVDKATNTETVGSLAVNIDPNTPSVTTNVSPASAAKSSNPVVATVSGRVTDAISGVGSVTYSVVDEYGLTQPSGSVVINANGNYSLTLSLPATKNVGDLDGHKYTITVRGYDRAGNTATDSDTLKIN